MESKKNHLEQATASNGSRLNQIIEKLKSINETRNVNTSHQTVNPYEDMIMRLLETFDYNTSTFIQDRRDGAYIIYINNNININNININNINININNYIQHNHYHYHNNNDNHNDNHDERDIAMPPHNTDTASNTPVITYPTEDDTPVQPCKSAGAVSTVSKTVEPVVENQSSTEAVYPNLDVDGSKHKSPRSRKNGKRRDVEARVISKDRRCSRPRRHKRPSF